MEIREIIGIYVAQLTHVLVLGSLPNFYGQKGQFWANFCDRQGLELVAYYSTTGRNIENRKQQGSLLTISLSPQI